MNNLAVLYANHEKYDEAEELYVECLEKKISLLGEDHPETLGTVYNLATMYANQGKFKEAEAYYSECVERATRVLGPDHPQTKLYLHAYSQVKSRCYCCCIC